jgi:acyl-coenzyme A synthetase/AMP-(fatty) acid ligase
MTALFPFGVGAAGIVFPERSTPEKLFELIARHRPTIMVGVPTAFNAVVEHPNSGRQDLSCLRLCTSSGEALPIDVYEKWKRAFGVEICEGVGSSEMYYNIYLSSRLGAGRPGTVGQLVPGYRAKIVDEGGVPLGDDEVGELLVAGESAAIMYWNDNEKSNQTFVGGWVHTGDLFKRDSEDYFWYHGRVDDLLKVGGIWVAPLEVETSLLRHPAVVECAVVGYQSEGLVLPRAYVRLREGFTASSDLERLLQEHVRTALSPHKCPRSVWFVTQLPHTANGKVDRRALRAHSAQDVGHGT